VSHVFYREPLEEYPEILGGKGVYLHDANGRTYRDGSGGAALSAIGHGPPAVRRAMHEQLARFARSQDHLVGIILLHPAQDIPETEAVHLSALGVPIIFLQPGSPRGENLHTVSGDPHEDGALMARHLISAGPQQNANIRLPHRTDDLCLPIPNRGLVGQELADAQGHGPAFGFLWREWRRKR